MCQINKLVPIKHKPIYVSTISNYNFIYRKFGIAHYLIACLKVLVGGRVNIANIRSTKNER